MIMIMYFLLLFLFLFPTTNGVAMYIIGHIYVCYISRFSLVPLLLRIACSLGLIICFQLLSVSERNMYYLPNMIGLSWRVASSSGSFSITNRTTLVHYMKILSSVLHEYRFPPCALQCLKKLHNKL